MKIAVVTGASLGMGREYVKQLAASGEVDEIWALARNRDRLHELTQSVDFPIRTVPTDVSSKKDISEYKRLLSESGAQVIYLINNAGFGKFCAYNELPLEQSLNMIDTNCSAVVAMTLVTLPYMSKGARIINMSSASAFSPLPYINIYGSTKVFVRNYSRALNRELKPRGISVTAVCPYWVSTAFFETAHKHEGGKVITEYEVMYSPDAVVKKALRDCAKGRDTSIYGFVNKAQHVLAKLLPQSLAMTVWQHRHKLK